MKKHISVILVAVLIVFYGCVSPMKVFNGNTNGWRPTDFNPKDGILLIQKVKWPKNQQAKIEEFMKSTYPYKYEFEDGDLKVNNEKYSDKNIYRFALLYSYETKDLHQNDMTRSAMPITTFDFNFVDRLKGKEYPKSGISSSWASMTFKKNY